MAEAPLDAEVVCSLEDLLHDLKNARYATRILTATAVMADHRITVTCDDELFFPEFFAMFGGSVPGEDPYAGISDIHVDIRTTAHTKFGWFQISGSNDLPVDGQEFSFALQAERGTFEQLKVTEPGWNCLAFRGSNVPALAFCGRDGLFSLDSKWRDSILWYLFWRLLRSRSDAIFFHASALGIFGQGTIFVGPAGAGKSTTSLALAARGHPFLSDEIAGYLPDRGVLIPFRRPVGIKPGPRASAVEKGLSPAVAARIENDGFVRVDISTLFPVQAEQSIPLRRVVFLRGFAHTPALQRIAPGRAEIVELQPLMSSFLNAPHSRRVFELTRLLSTTKVYQLHPGDPDATAIYLEKAFAQE